MILSDSELRAAIQDGRIEISPYIPEHVNPVSIDLTLGALVGVYQRWVSTENAGPDGSGLRPHSEGILDAKEEARISTWEMGTDGWVIRPGIGYLMHTAERVHTKQYVPILDGKSSIGRLFIQVHATAGFGDPNFDGQFTLEVTSTHPVRVYPGMRICQIRFQTIEGTVENPYNGNYVGESAVGPVGSQCWKQFLQKSPDTLKPPGQSAKDTERVWIKSTEGLSDEALSEALIRLQDDLFSWYLLRVTYLDETPSNGRIGAVISKHDFVKLLLELPRLGFTMSRATE